MQYRLISTIIATHNRHELLRRTLDNLASQTYRPLEVLVIDDGSSPPARRIVEQWRAQVDDNLHVSYVLQTNQGPAVARNRGVALSSGDLIHFLDDDDLMDAQALACLAEAISGPDPQVAMAAYQDWRNGAPVGPLHDAPALPADGITRAMIGGSWFVPVHGYLFTRAAIELTGPWNPALTSQEDDDYLLRAAMAGVRFIPAPQARVYYCQHDGVRRATPGKPGESVRQGLEKRMVADLAIRESALARLQAEGTAHAYLAAFRQWQHRFQSRYGHLEPPRDSALLDWLDMQEEGLIRV